MRSSAETHSWDDVVDRLAEIADASSSAQGRIIIGIDGRCAAGKTTLAQRLRERLDERFEVEAPVSPTVASRRPPTLVSSPRLLAAEAGETLSPDSPAPATMTPPTAVIPMDHFFLRPEQRTAERFAEPGGNIDYERFSDEVIEPLRAGRPFSYQPFDCQAGELGAPIEVTPSRVTIVEGSYALHPRFADAYGLSVLLTVDPDTQRHRLEERSPGLVDRFEHEWIPLEERYLTATGIAHQVDAIIDTSDGDTLTVTAVEGEGDGAGIGVTSTTAHAAVVTSTTTPPA
ncbi:MAG: hypothetical protein LBM23_07335 [Propionibacteriaceae bacterium]|jgi:uridine kinase|nr:hypothetical protein [Propionibacteriaceae bacterium]